MRCSLIRIGNFGVTKIGHLGSYTTIILTGFILILVHSLFYQYNFPMHFLKLSLDRQRSKLYTTQLWDVSRRAGSFGSLTLARKESLPKGWGVGGLAPMLPHPLREGQCILMSASTCSIR